MRAEGFEIDLPSLESNPFSTSPLEANQSNLYVGRLGVIRRISQHINFMSNRRILMVGDLGSGRTSLLRCLGQDAPVYVHIDYLSASMPGQSLLARMYSELVDYQIPENSVEIVNKMVEFSRTFDSKIPLIVIDLPNIEGSSLSIALREVLPALERLKAVVVVVVDPKQRTSLPDKLINSFANIENISPLSVDELQELIERRIATVSSKDFTLSFEHASKIHHLTNGLPIEIVKYMRDIIDNDMMQKNEHKNLGMQDNNLTEAGLERPQDYVNEEANKIWTPESVTSIIDASIPWHQRIEQEKHSQTEFQESLFGFELDLDELSESQLFDNSVDDSNFSAIPKSEGLVNKPASKRPEINAGAFGGLLNRTRKFTDSGQPGPTDMVNDGNIKGAELWVSKDLVEVEDVSEPTLQNSAELLHDEIGIDNNQSFDSEIKIQDELKYNITDEINDESISQLLSLISDLLKNKSKNSQHDSNDFIDSLLNLSTPKYSSKQDFPLNPSVLSNLNESESYVLSIAKVRKYSPSDAEMLGYLRIKRPRLSQISNKLLKSGILNVRMKGRSRYFALTQAARAQLIAWGIIGGDE